MLKKKLAPITCRPFETFTDAKSYAMLQSDDNRDTRYIILTGDLFFVSTTADIQPYEQLITYYEKGAEVHIKKEERLSLKTGYQEYNNKYKTASSYL